MKIPTIHCIDNNKIICGKKKGLYMEIKDFKKSLRTKTDFTLDLAGCKKCKNIIQSKSKHP